MSYLFYYAIVFAPIILLINTYGLSKVYKRYFNNLCISKCLTFGFITTITAFCLPMIPLTLFSVSLAFLSYYFLSIQIILLVIYCMNWRWFFITWKIDLKKLAIYGLVFIAVFLG